jgi:type II secretory pathway pseudopilin PulG
MKKSFTLFELIIIIIVVGILASAIIPRMQTNSLNQAAIQLLSDLRYTQHLAMIDDKYDKNDLNWYKKRWQLAFISSKAANGGPSYTIFSDTSGNSTGDANEIEIAINPLNKTQRMTGGHSGDKDLNINSSTFIGMKKLNLKYTYGITGIKLSKSCKVYGSKRIYFDYLGRPLKGKLGKANGGGNTSAYESNNLIERNCEITLEKKEDSISIRITPETGYSCILNKGKNSCI